MSKRLFLVRRVVETEMFIYATDEDEADEIADRYYEDEYKDVSSEVTAIETWDGLPFDTNGDHVPWGTDDTYQTIAQILGEP